MRLLPIDDGSDWQASAACRGKPAEWFFPDRERHSAALQYNKARPICALCAVRDECREYAIVNNITLGMWGGTTPGQREEERSRRRQQGHGGSPPAQ